MNESNRRPVHEIRFGAVKVVIWRNATANGHMFNVTAARLYKENDAWKESSGFGVDDLLVLSRALGDAFAWIHAQRAPAPQPLNPDV
ncbi:MAG: hypothetical protein KDA32_10710 [Phycisphaerales bacterium]|nr:hypothetical protein [Phycisphaerales bacterium]